MINALLILMIITGAIQLVSAIILAVLVAQTSHICKSDSDHRRTW